MMKWWTRSTDKVDKLSLQKLLIDLTASGFEAKKGGSVSDDDFDCARVFTKQSLIRYWRNQCKTVAGLLTIDVVAVSLSNKSSYMSNVLFASRMASPAIL